MSIAVVARIFVTSFLLVGSASAADTLASGTAAIPKAYFPASDMRKGDVLQVRAPHLLGDETLVLARCGDDCSSAQVVSVWRHGFRSENRIDNRVIRSNFTLRENGRYFFWLVKNSDCYVDPWACRNSAWPGVLTYGKPQALAITATKRDGSIVKLKFDSGTLVYVRQLELAPAPPKAG
jgi:hypothetical protein